MKIEKKGSEVDYKLLVGGKWEETGEWSEVLSPYDDSLVGRVAQGDEQTVSRAVDEAQAAFNLERNALDRARLNATLETEKPRFTQRMKTLLNRIILND